MVTSGVLSFYALSSSISGVNDSVRLNSLPTIKSFFSILDAMRTAFSYLLISVTLIALFDTPIVPRSCTSLYNASSKALVDGSKPIAEMRWIYLRNFS
jgi:hypothetical protein